MTSSPSAPASRLALIAAFAAIYFVWGSTYLAIAFAVRTIPPFLAIGARFACAGVVMYAVLRLLGVERPEPVRALNAGVVGFMTLGVGTGLVAWAEQHIASGFVALLITAVPLWLVLLDWKMLRGGAPARQVVWGLVLGFAGITILAGPELRAGLGDSSALAVLLVLVGTISWSAGSLRSKMIRMPRHVFMSAAVQMGAGGLMVLLVGLVLGEYQRLDFASISVESAGAWLYLVLVGSFVAYSAWVYLLEHAPPKQISSYAFVNPIVAVFLGWWLADETVNGRILVAVVIMVAAVALIVRYGGTSGAPPTRSARDSNDLRVTTEPDA